MSCTLCFVYVVSLPSGCYAIIQANMVPAELAARFGVARLQRFPRRTFRAAIAGDVPCPDEELSREEVQIWVDEHELRGDMVLT
jgi:hypothetical protein